MMVKILILLISVVFLLHCSTETKQEAQPQAKPQPQEQPQQPQVKPEAPVAPPVVATPTEEPAITGNQPPRLKSAKFHGLKGGGFRLEVETEDPEQDPVNLRYSWRVNGEVVSDSDSIGTAKKGDSIEVTVTPNDGSSDGRSDTISMMVKNTPPTVEQSKEITFTDEGFMTYPIKASDPDGDKLTFKILKGPEGLAVDSESGMVSWDTKDVPNGTYSATVEVTDNVSTQVYTFQVNLTRQ